MVTDVLLLDCERTDYSPGSVLENRKTLTVGELKEFLEDYEDDTPVILSHDRGYTYGAIHRYNFSIEPGVEVEYKNIKQNEDDL